MFFTREDAEKSIDNFLDKFRFLMNVFTFS